MIRFSSFLIAFFLLTCAAVPRTHASPPVPAACVGMTFDQTIDASNGGTVVGSSGLRYMVFLGKGASVSLLMSGASCYEAVDLSHVSIAASLFNHADVCVMHSNTSVPMFCDTVTH